MHISDYADDRSRATAPLFYRAPFPRGKDGAEPREFQFAGAEYALARDHCLIGDEPGVGKTLQAILIGNAIEAKKTLVVCPASLRLNWQREIWRWSTVPNVSTYPVMAAGHGVHDKAHYNIISYDLLRNKSILAAILAQRWDHVILDEAHAIKSRDAKRTRALIDEDKIPSVTGRFTALTGTPLPNQPIEIYNLARLLAWDAIDYMSEDDFRNHYYGLGEGMIRTSRPVWNEKLKANVSASHIEWSDQVRNAPRNLDELQHRLRSKIMVRRLKEHVHKQLPAKQFHLIPLAITPEMKAALKHPGWGMAERLHDLDPDSFAHAMPDGEISTARRLLGEAKAGPACDYVIDLLEGGVEKVVVSAWHSSVLAKAREKLSRYGMVYMDGGTGSSARQAAVDKFQKDPTVRVILGQTAVLGVGWTLTAAQDVVLLESEWVPGVTQQMVDRIHRMGQKGSRVTAHLPIVPGALDERITSHAITKGKAIHAALDGQPGGK